MSAKKHINLEEYTSETSYISNCVDGVVITKRIKSFSNQKAWMNGDVRALLKNLPFSQVTMKQQCQRKTDSWHQGGKVKTGLERDVNTSNTNDMWQVIKNITGYKSRSGRFVFLHGTLKFQLL